MTTHLIQTSGGKGSWYTGRRVVEDRMKPGDHLLLAFADTKTEDEDLYRFLDEACADLLARLPEGCTGELLKLADGRDVWQVFNDKRFIGNTRIDPCSAILKRNLIRDWMEANLDPASTVVYLGIDWTEAHRFERAEKRWLPWRVEAPLCEAPYVTPEEIIAEMTAAGIKQPRLYDLGFAHNNCGGFCVKSGQAQFKLLLEKMPERYAEHERQELSFRANVGKDVAILRDRSQASIMQRMGLGDDDVEIVTLANGAKKTHVKATGEPLPTTLPLTMREFRQRLEGGTIDVDPFDIGGCACFTPDHDIEITDDTEEGVA